MKLKNFNWGFANLSELAKDALQKEKSWVQEQRMYLLMKDIKNFRKKK